MNPMKHLSIIAAIAFATAVSASLNAQDYEPVPVTISKEKVRVDGNVYFSHIVMERQTLYSISKAYNVTIEQIYEANPSVRQEGLKKNAIILIPATGLKEARTSQPESVKSQPARDNKAGRQEDVYIIHTVKWFEDLDSISEKYGVPVDVIMQENGLTGRKLTRRQKLRIPTGPTETQAAPAEDNALQEKKEEQNKAAAQATASVMTGKDKVKAVLLLPFDSREEKPHTGSIDFYCGSLLALKHLGEKGTDIDLTVYDTSHGAIPFTEILLLNSDIVIGPIAAGDLSSTIARCPSGTTIVSPLDHRAEYLADSYPNFIQAPSSSLTQYEDLAGWIKEEQAGNAEKVVVIYEKGSRDVTELGVMNTILEKDGIAFSSFSYSILEGRDVLEPLKGMMTTEAANRVLVMSESEAFVNDVVRNLNLLIFEDYEIVLYAPSKIRSFETIEVDNLHNARLHTSLSYYVDYGNPAVKDFVKQYRALYNTEPTPYAFQGYDITVYFMEMCSEYGEEWESNLEGHPACLLQTDFDFSRAGEGKGFTNSGMRRIVYGPDYSIQLARE